MTRGPILSPDEKHTTYHCRKTQHHPLPSVLSSVDERTRVGLNLTSLFFRYCTCTWVQMWVRFLKDSWFWMSRNKHIEHIHHDCLLLIVYHGIGQFGFILLLTQILFE